MSPDMVGGKDRNKLGKRRWYIEGRGGRLERTCENHSGGSSNRPRANIKRIWVHRAGIKRPESNIKNTRN